MNTVMQPIPSLVAHLLKEVAGAISFFQSSKVAIAVRRFPSFVLCGAPWRSFVRGSHEQDSLLPARAQRIPHQRRPRISRTVEQFTGDAKRLDDLIELLDRRRGVVLSSGTTVPGRYESFDLGFADPPLVLETAGSDFSLSALNARGEVLIAFLGDVLREPCVVISEKSPTRLAGHIIRGAAPVEEDQRTRRASVMSLVRDLVAALVRQ